MSARKRKGSVGGDGGDRVGGTEALLSTMVVENPETYEEYNEFNFHQSHRHVNSNWILLEKCSTTDIFCNTHLLTDIWDLKIQCNAITKVINQVGTLNSYGTVWYCKDDIT
jgi:hypothetical protein